MDVAEEAKQIMIQALGKMYSSRTQRGGLRLHRSLLLTLVMKSARDIYHSVRLPCENESLSGSSPGVQEKSPRTDEAMDTTGTKDSEAPTSYSELPTQSVESGQRSGHENDPHSGGLGEIQSDKENRSPSRLDQNSRKRRGKTTSEPDFLPCKKAKMEAGEVRRILQSSTLRTNSGNSCRTLESLTTTITPRTLVTC
ncbi:immediate early response gene 2 protein [Chanos chanos]|uniref:Immediate early response gene 2 protein n=1 Tax=Chanos chanos TaxID=29144 RepID=A0A6J2VY77_CHACN|nr:immediate early response gene 2 protein-like [Chanos chanos]